MGDSVTEPVGRFPHGIHDVMFQLIVYNSNQNVVRWLLDVLPSSTVLQVGSSLWLLIEIMSNNDENAVPRQASNGPAGKKRTLTVNPLELGPRKRPYVFFITFYTLLTNYRLQNCI
jgi:hypothetical protein